MRIALFSDCYTPVHNGVVTVLRTLKRELENRGVHVLLFAPGAESQKGALVEDPREPGVYRLPSLPFNRQTGDRLALIPPWVQKVVEDKLRQEEIQLIHLHTEFALARCAVRAARRLKIPLVYTPHTRWGEFRHYLPLTYLLPKKLIPRLMTLPLRNRCCAVAAPSPAMADRLKKLFPGIPCEIIPNSVNPTILQQTSRKNRLRKMKPEEETINLLYAGRISREKRIIPLVRALIPLFQNDPCWRMKILGSGNHERSLVEIIKQSGLGDRLIFPGTVPWEEMTGYYQEADIFVSASRSEVNPMTGLEALVCELPLLVSNDEGFTPLVEHNRSGWLAEDTREFIGRLKEFREMNRDQRRAMGRAGTALFRRRFSCGQFLLKYQNWYEKAINLHL